MVERDGLFGLTPRLAQLPEIDEGLLVQPIVPEGLPELLLCFFSSSNRL